MAKIHEILTKLNFLYNGYAECNTHFTRPLFPVGVPLSLSVRVCCSYSLLPFQPGGYQSGVRRTDGVPSLRVHLPPPKLENSSHLFPPPLSFSRTGLPLLLLATTLQPRTTCLLLF